MLQIAHLHERSNLGVWFDPSPELPAPRLTLAKESTIKEFSSSLIALFRGPAPSKHFAGDSFFRDCWIDQKTPKYAFAVATVLQVVFVLAPPPIWSERPSRTVSAAPHEQITWYGPARDLPLLLPPMRAAKPAARKDSPKPLPHPGAVAFHPRQTILSEPLHPTHPRQALVQPRAPQEPPKILPALPNIVQLASSEPERPKLQLSAKVLRSLRPNVRTSLRAANTAAPDISALEKQPGAIDIASSSQVAPKPVLTVNPMSAPRAALRKMDASVATPDIRGGTGGSETLIALSAAPAPVAPPAIPAGNLSARVAISPDVAKPGTPAGAASGTAGGGHGPEGIFITGGNSANPSPVSGLGIGPAQKAGGLVLPSRANLRARIAPEGSKSLSEEAEGAALAAPKLGMTPQEVLGAKRVYTLHVNMPNLTSASGSWILNFAELHEMAPAGYARPDAADLTGPAPLVKVDPKYPPEFRLSHIDGEVVLYAIIRKDGSVDSIQLVHSVDERLDANAMEALAQWKFRPAQKNGEPVDLEAVVHIPFRSR